MTDPAQLKIIAIHELQPGMYVVSVHKQKGNLEIKTQGWARTVAVIEQLKIKGVLELVVDLSKTLTEPKAEVVPPSEPKPAVAGGKIREKVSFEQELRQANILYQHAKGLQKKAFSDIEAGRELNLQQFQDCATGFIDSVFRNQDALLCISRIREKDAYLLEHSVNVSILMTIFAKQMQFDEDLIQQLATGALLHDIGKILIPDSILNKPGKLTAEEFTEMRSHVVYSREILEKTPGLSPISVEVAAVHHERLDGKGYPLGLTEQHISVYGRMISIVDTYDAITAHRCYKEGQTGIAALKILKRESPQSFDPVLVAQFIKAIGIHPVGSLVKLSNEKLAVVIKANAQDPLRPVLKVFYNCKFKRYIDISIIDLASSKVDIEIEGPVMPEDYGIDMPRFFRQSILE
ncbi:HD-GYP domain-containing protein [Rheinheimera sediminis]|uniref:HD-GYP domain-containing protein n=1 Tax=Rheinheimera sp. YQF-1 TaxID=2499626 RepID=UPI000FD9EAEF|nr:HD-GYP domain-containing protein [Rheinheimera sp. YQF-1]RVT44127.1 HD-GYP domain-containing protein [Rheinheimera sp. YQF-1]